MVSMHFDIKAIFVVILFMTTPTENAGSRRHGHSSSLHSPHVRSTSKLDRLSEDQLRYLYGKLRDNSKLQPVYARDTASHGYENKHQKHIKIVDDPESNDNTDKELDDVPVAIGKDQTHTALESEEGSHQTGSGPKDDIVLQTSHTSADIGRQDFENMFDHAVDNAMQHMMEETNKDTDNTGEVWEVGADPESAKSEVYNSSYKKMTEIGDEFIIIKHVDERSGEKPEKQILLLKLKVLCGKYFSMCEVVTRADYPSLMIGNHIEREVDQGKETEPHTGSMSKHKEVMIVKQVYDKRGQTDRMKVLVKQLKQLCGNSFSKCKLISKNNLPDLIRETKTTQILNSGTTPKPTVQTTLSTAKVEVQIVQAEKPNPPTETVQNISQETISKVAEQLNSITQKSHLEQDKEKEKLLMLALSLIKDLKKDMTNVKTDTKCYCPPCHNVTMTSTTVRPVNNPLSNLSEFRKYLSRIRSRFTAAPTTSSHWSPVPAVKELNSEHIVRPVNTHRNYLGDKAVWIGIGVGFGTSWLLMLLLFGCYRFLVRYRNERQNEQLQKLCNRQCHDDMHITMEKINKNKNGNHYVVSIKNDKKEEDGWSSEEEVFNMSDTRAPTTSTPVGTPVKKPPRLK